MSGDKHILGIDCLIMEKILLNASLEIFNEQFIPQSLWSLEDKHIVFQETSYTQECLFQCNSEHWNRLWMASYSPNVPKYSLLCVQCNVRTDNTVSCVPSLPCVRAIIYFLPVSVQVNSRKVTCNFQSHFMEKDKTQFQIMHPAVDRVRVWNHTPLLPMLGYDQTPPSPLTTLMIP